MSYLAVFIKEKNGEFSASVPVLPGCFSQGKDLNEARDNIEKAIRLYLKDEKDLNNKKPKTQLVSFINVK